jgi:phage I-like protein
MARVIKLKTFKATLNGVSETGELPSRLKLFDWGTNKTSEGDFLVDEGSVAVFAANQNRLQRQTIQVDFNHNTVEGTPAYLAAKGAPEMAGYGIPVIIPGEGIFLEGVETTPSGQSKAADYKDLSPAPLVDSSNRVVGLHSVALVPAGATEGLTIESAKLKALSASLKTLAVPDTKMMGDKPQPNAYRVGKSENDGAIMDETKKAVLAALGADEDMDYEDVCEKLKAVFHKTDGRKGPLDSPAPGTEIVERCLKAVLPDALGAAIKPLSTKLDEQAETIRTLQSTLAAETNRVQDQERANLLAQAAKDGKLIPLSADDVKEMPIKLLTSMVANLKKDKIATVKPLAAPDRDDKGNIIRAIKPLSAAAQAINDSISARYGEEFTNRRN